MKVIFWESLSLRILVIWHIWWYILAVIWEIFCNFQTGQCLCGLCSLIHTSEICPRWPASIVWIFCILGWMHLDFHPGLAAAYIANFFTSYIAYITKVSDLITFQLHSFILHRTLKKQKSSWCLIGLKVSKKFFLSLMHYYICICMNLAQFFKQKKFQTTKGRGTWCALSTLTVASTCNFQIFLA